MGIYRLMTEHGISDRVQADSACEAGADFRAAMPGVRLLRIQQVI